MVVGAGFGGIAAGVKMKRAGIHTFTIYESSLGIGGTWWDNTYPGAEVDVGSHLYSYSFKPHDWTRTHAQQAELQKYLEETVDEYGLRPHLRLGVAVESATWDDDRHVWTVRLDDGTTDEGHVLISGVGFLNVPRYPDWPGLDGFEGAKFHTSRWEHQHDLTDQVVAVVGTGSTATQIVPAIQPIVRRLYVFQREPGWVMPKGDRDFTPEERARVREPVAAPAGAPPAQVVVGEEHLGREDLPRRHQGERGASRSSASTTSSGASRTVPTCVTAVTPRYPYPGKRPIFAVDLLSRAQGAQRRAGAEGGGVDDPDRDRRRRRRRTRDRRPRDGDRLPARELPRAACRSSGGPGRPSRSTGPASRTRTSASPSRSSPTSSFSTGRAPTAARS